MSAARDEAKKLFKKEGKKRPKDDSRISIYLGDLRQEIESEAARLDRPMSWLIRRAWQIAREEIAYYQTDPIKNPED
jgi:uncharacterized small protein (TIGR04563 family)